MIQNEEIARLWRKEKEVWDKKDVDGIFEVLEGSQGYGYRTKTWRTPSQPTPEQKRFTEKWLNDMEYLVHEDIDLNTWSENDLGLAWGFYSEKFKHFGQPPEETRIRFARAHYELL